MLVAGLAISYPGSFPVVALRLFSPYAYFADPPGGEGQVTTWRGSPRYFSLAAGGLDPIDRVEIGGCGRKAGAAGMRGVAELLLRT
jgi:hypothetical protein